MNNLKIHFANYINGKWSKDDSAGKLEIRNKFSNELITSLPLASENEIELSIVSACEGFKTLKSWSAGKRSEYLQRLWNALNAKFDEAVQLIIAEAGKPKSYAEAEVKRCLATIEHAVTEAKRFSGEIIPMDFGASEGKTAFTKRFPIGPVLCITPFNFPMNLVLHKLAPALAVGCSVIVKPAPQSPLSALFLANLLDEVGYPAGVANFVNCSIPMAEVLVRDHRLSMVSFTGSEKVGWFIKSICGTKKIALELGGNAAVIVDDGVDINAVAKTIANGAYLYAGQICISTQRIFVHEKIFPQFQSILIEEIKKIKIGDPKDESTIIGPLIDKVHLKRINDWVQEAISLGAKILIGGKIESEEHNLFQATLLSETKTGMKVVDEEAFGPIAIIEKFKRFSEAIEKVNASKFGLQAGVFTNNFENVKQSHNLLEVGGVIINNIPGFRMDSMPYGGIKMSGLGREGVRYAMEEMSEPRLMVY